jgi:MarR family transcriptional regulator, organic hydroperoxide resistance regulator
MSRMTPHESPQSRADEPFAAWNMPELDGVDELSERAFRAFLVTAHLHFKNMMTTMAGSHTHPGQVMCLRLLGVNDGASQRDMARMLHVAPPTVSKMLTTMEKTGLVERRPDEADQRLTRVYLTDAGRERGDEMGTAVGEYVNATFATLTERERRDLARLLQKLGERISEVAAAHCDEEDGR